MTKRLIATIAAAAIGLTAVSAAPAKALDSRDIGRILLGTGAVIVLGNALSKHNKRRNTKVYRHHTRPVHRNNFVRVPGYCIHGFGHNRWVDWHCARRAGY